MFDNKKIKREDEMEKEKENEIDRRIKILSKKKPELKYRELRQIAKEEINKNANRPKNNRQFKSSRQCNNINRYSITQKSEGRKNKKANKRNKGRKNVLY